MDKVQALVAYWNSFGIPAYETTSVPDNATFPYMTYEIATDSFNSTVAVTNNLWYKSTSWAEITRQAQNIADSIGMGGSLVRYDGGVIWINRGTPYSQRVADDKLKRLMLNFSLEFISEN